MPSRRASAQASCKYPSATRFCSWSGTGSRAWVDRSAVVIFDLHSGGIRFRTPVPNPEADVSTEAKATKPHIGERLITAGLIGVAGGNFTGDFGAFVEIAANCQVSRRGAGAIGLLKTAVTAIEP